jgi:hypothetical protein
LDDYQLTAMMAYVFISGMANVAEEGPGLKLSGRGESASISYIPTFFTTFPLGTRAVQRRKEMAGVLGAS